ncbi:MAG: NUDIX domain-containing protein [Candidatus Daviesbacteria bacterium]|nr:NUDIX domain-containing protein [Candidatus Daviesbacteria bacterium]
MDQTILAVDDRGEFLEYIPKEVGHTGDGKRHLAIAVLLYNSKGQVLLQKRKHKIFDNIWDITGATHPLRSGNTDETMEEATERCLSEEWGIKQKITLKNLGFFNYFAKYNGFCENEHCFLMTGQYDGELSLNPDLGYEYKWVERAEFLKDIAQNPANYTPWAKEASRLLPEYLQ